MADLTFRASLELDILLPKLNLTCSSSTSLKARRFLGLRVVLFVEEHHPSNGNLNGRESLIAQTLRAPPSPLLSMPSPASPLPPSWMIKGIRQV